MHRKATEMNDKPTAIYQNNIVSVNSVLVEIDSQLSNIFVMLKNIKRHFKFTNKKMVYLIIPENYS